MKPELKQKILQFNRRRKLEGEKAADLDVIAAAINALPPGQAKKFLTQPVLDVLAKYGYKEV